MAKTAIRTPFARRLLRALTRYPAWQQEEMFCHAQSSPVLTAHQQWLVARVLETIDNGRAALTAQREVK